MAWVAIFLVSEIFIFVRVIQFVISYFFIREWDARCLIDCIFIFVQVISLEGWTDIMYYVQDAHSFWDWIYFVLLIVVCDDFFYL